MRVLRVTLSAGLLAISLAAGSAFAEERISLDAVLTGSPIRDVPTIFGLVHAASPSAPSDALIEALHPAYWRTGSLTADLVPRMRSVGAIPVHVVSDIWGYPMDGHAPPFEDLAAFSAQVRRQAELLGPDALYDIWNEANSADFWMGWFAESPTRIPDAERKFYDTFEAAYRAIETVHGDNTRIAGPSLNIYKFDALRRFMDEMLARDVRVDTLAWHDFPTTLEGVAAIQTHLEEARRAFIEDPRYAHVGVKHLLVAESMSYETHFAPGLLFAHLFHAEAGGAVGLLRACWDEPARGKRTTSNCWNNSLDGLLTQDGAPRAAYWAMAAYAATGRGRIGALALAPGIYAIASHPANGHTSVVLASARDGAVVVGIPKLPGTVRATRITMAGNGRAAMPRPGVVLVTAREVRLEPQQVIVLDFAAP